MKTQHLSLSLFLLALTLLATHCGKKENNPGKLFKGEVIAVKTIALSPATEEQEITATGLIGTENEARYGFKVGGVIEKMAVKEGEYFKKGQLLATLKQTEINAGLNQAELALQKAARDHNRVVNLYSDSVATLEQLQNVKTALDVAKLQFEAVSFNRNYASIYAQADGFVVSKLANVGEVIAAGSPVLATAQEGANGWVLKVGVSDKQWAAIPIRAPASLQLEAFPDKVFKGVVSRKSLAADQVSGSFGLEIKLLDFDVAQAIGMFGKASIRTGAGQSYTPIPHEALIEADGKKAFVFVPAGEKGVRKIPIAIESFDGQRVKVKSGLEDVREIILTNSAFLNEKSLITIKND
jgi:RND family efflux transporter MFP subunit